MRSVEYSAADITGDRGEDSYTLTGTCLENIVANMIVMSGRDKSMIFQGVDGLYLIVPVSIERRLETAINLGTLNPPRFRTAFTFAKPDCCSTSMVAWNWLQIRVAYGSKGSGISKVGKNGGLS